MKLSVKFCGAILLLLCVTLGGTAWVLLHHQQETMYREVRNRAQTVLSFGESCRAYAREDLAPAVRAAVEPHSATIMVSAVGQVGGLPNPWQIGWVAETMIKAPHSTPLIFEAESATVVLNGIFKHFHKHGSRHTLREAALNPLNLLDQANDEEELLIRAFQADPQLPERDGYSQRDGQEYYYVARPIVVQQKCLRCHGQPEEAPPGLVQRYPGPNGYLWRAGDINSALIVTVPTDDIRAQQSAVRWKLLGVFGAITVLLVGLIALLFQTLVHSRLRQAARVMEQVAANPTGPTRLPARGRDELGSLARTFNAMADAVRDSHLLLERRVDERTHALALSNASLQAILDAATEVALIATDCSGTITLFNSGAQRMLGYRAEEVIGKQSLSLFHVEQELAAHARELSTELGTPVEGLACVFERARRGGHEECDWTFIRKDGTVLTVNLAVTGKRNKDGELMGFLALGVDVTEQRRAAVALREARDAAEAANRAKGEFLANMSHEIRTPMNGILGMTDLALGTDLTAEQQEYLTMVKDSADALLGVINDVLDFSKIEAGKLDLDPVEFRLRDLLAGTLRALSLRANAKGLELAYHVAPDLPDALIGDPKRLRQILVNLVGNAIKFAERGEVVVNVEPASGGRQPPVQASQQGADAPRSPEVELHFSVRDTGIGIPADKLAFIFAPFAQADSSITRKYGGTGLGLTISNRLVQLMGGKVWVESTPGEGSTFHFTVCLGLGVQTDLAAEPRYQTKLRGQAVLVVDDNATNRRLLEEMLAGWQMRPTTVDSACAALGELERMSALGEPYTLVLVDACMPHQDGFSLVEQMRRRPHLDGAAVVMLSSTDRQGDRARCRELGVARYLTKPIKQSELLNALCDLVGTSTSKSEAERPHLAQGREAGPRPTPHQGRLLRILLAEDNPINQKLAVRLLEREGHQVAVVGDGAAAVKAVQAQPFDLVLMDLQMPIMGGLEATVAIRAWERGQAASAGAAQPGLPILAMTARAMKGDREACLAAGMNGYIAKPVQLQELRQTIRGVLGLEGPQEQREKKEKEKQTPDPQPSRSASGPTLFDPQRLFDQLGGDPVLLRELAEMFLRDCPQLQEQVRRALEKGDARQVRLTAHTLKGSVSNFTTGEAVQHAQTLERMGADGNLNGCWEVFQSLDSSLQELGHAIEDWLAKDKVPGIQSVQ